VNEEHLPLAFDQDLRDIYALDGHAGILPSSYRVRGPNLGFAWLPDWADGSGLAAFGSFDIFPPPACGRGKMVATAARRRQAPCSVANRCPRPMG
jgi:hypothetical protein